jgi:hypothetical protein
MAIAVVLKFLEEGFPFCLSNENITAIFTNDRYSIGFFFRAIAEFFEVGFGAINGDLVHNLMFNLGFVWLFYGNILSKYLVG